MREGRGAAREGRQSRRKRVRGGGTNNRGLVEDLVDEIVAQSAEGLHSRKVPVRRSVAL